MAFGRRKTKQDSGAAPSRLLIAILPLMPQATVPFTNPSGRVASTSAATWPASSRTGCTLQRMGPKVTPPAERRSAVPVHTVPDNPDTLTVDG